MRSHALAIVLVLLVSGCSSAPVPTAPSTNGPAGTSAALFNGIAATLTGDSTLGAIAASPSGEKVGVFTQSGTAGQIARVTGAALLLPDGGFAVVYSGDEGLPTRAVFGDVVVLFSRYTSNTVNIEAVVPDGTVYSARGVSVDPKTLEDLRSLVGQIVGSTAGFRPTALDQAAQLAFSLKYSGTLLSLAGCLMSTASLAPTLGASSVFFVAACSSAIVKVLALIFPSLDNPLLAASGVLLSTVSCAGQHSLVGCASVLMIALRSAEATARNRVSSVPPSTPVSTRRYVVSASSLYLSDFTATGTDALIAGIATANRTQVSVTDIAVTPEGKAYAVSFSNLYAISTSTGTVTPIGSGSLRDVNSLTNDASGNLWAASAGDGSLFRVDKNNGSASLIGRFGSGWVSSGDLAFDSSGTLWAAVRRSTDPFDTLVTVNTSTGAATFRGASLPVGIFGLIFANGALYGLSSSTNSLYVINTNTGVATFVRKLSFSPYGTSRR